MVDYVYRWVTISNGKQISQPIDQPSYLLIQFWFSIAVSAQLDSLDAAVKSTLTSALLNPVTMVELVLICHKDTVVNALAVTRASIVKRKSAIAATTPVQREPCARMNPDTKTILVYVEADTLVPIAMLQLIPAQQTEIHAQMVQHVWVC